MWTFAVAELEAEPPVVRVLTAVAGQDAAQPGKDRPGGLRHEAGHQGRLEQLASEAAEVGDRSAAGVRRGAVEHRPGHPEWIEDALPEEVGERDAGTGLDEAGRHLVATVGVDAPPAGRAEDRVTVRRQPGRVGEQVAQGGAGRPGRLVELDLAALDGGEHGQGGDELGDRGPGVRPVDRSGRGQRVVSVGDQDRRARHGPVLDDVQGVHRPTSKRWTSTIALAGSSAYTWGNDASQRTASPKA